MQNKHGFIGLIFATSIGMNSATSQNNEKSLSVPKWAAKPLHKQPFSKSFNHL